jgi:hypothetical protein
MSKNRTFETRIFKNSKKIQKFIYKILTDYAAINNNNFIPGFFSAAKKDYLEELKNGHL